MEGLFREGCVDGGVIKGGANGTVVCTRWNRFFGEGEIVVILLMKLNPCRGLHYSEFSKFRFEKLKQNLYNGVLYTQVLGFIYTGAAYISMFG